MVKEDNSAITWEAEEYIEKDHNTGWYIGLFVVAAILIGLAIWLQQWTFLALVVMSVIVILFSCLKPPRKISYKLDSRGLTEGKTLHSFAEFRAFGIMNEDAHYSAVLIPKKRLGIQIKVYFPEKNGEEIVDALGMRLPMEEVKMDFLDKIVKFLRI